MQRKFRTLVNNFVWFYSKIRFFFHYLSNADVENRFYSKIRILFIYLSNADVENCGESRGFGFIYIYIYIWMKMDVNANVRIDRIKYERLN